MPYKSCIRNNNYAWATIWSSLLPFPKEFASSGWSSLSTATFEGRSPHTSCPTVYNWEIEIWGWRIPIEVILSIATKLGKSVVMLKKWDLPFYETEHLSLLPPPPWSCLWSLRGGGGDLKPLLLFITLLLLLRSWATTGMGFLFLVVLTMSTEAHGKKGSSKINWLLEGGSLEFLFLR